MTKLHAVSWVSFAVLATIASAAAEPSYTTFDAPGATNTLVLSMNAGGTVIGFYQSADQTDHGFLRTPDGTITTFDVPDAGTGRGKGTTAEHINNLGVIVGDYTDDAGKIHGYLRTPDGTITTFDVPGAANVTDPNSINDTGTIVGIYDHYNYKGFIEHRGFVRASNGAITILRADSAALYFPADIDAAGDITGYYLRSGYAHKSQGFIWSADGTITLIGCSDSTAGGFDDAGDILGDCYYFGKTRGFIRAPDGSMTTFRVSNLDTEPSAISNYGATGLWQDSNHMRHGFLRYSNGKMKRFDVPGAGTDAFQGTEPIAINNGGLIAGTFVGSDDTSHGFLRTP